MKKIILVLNHVQAGFGSDENAMLSPGGKKSAIGPGKTLEPLLAELDAKIIATLYCGDQYFVSNPLEVQKKFVGFAKKFQADAILCGPAMHYPLFGEMCGSLAKVFNEQEIPAIAAMSLENPATEKYSKMLPVVKMPKKGGVGLNDSLRNMAQLVVEKANHRDAKMLEEKICF